MKIKSLDIGFKFSRKKFLLLVGVITFCLLNSLLNFYHVSYYSNNYLTNKSINSTDQEFKIHKADMSDISNGSEINIVFDASHHQYFSLWDTGFAGYSDLAIFLMNNSFHVSASTRFLNETIPSLNNNDILVLNYGNNQTYTNQEINLIDQFVSDGGGLLVFGDHGNRNDPYGINTFQNKLLEKFNISIDFNRINDSVYNYYHEKYIVFNSSYFDLTNITFFAAASLTLGTGATPIAICSENSNPLNAVVGAKCEYGEGRVICVTDAEFIWNGDARIGRPFNFGMKIGNNSKFILKIIKWLVNKSISSNNIQVLPEYSLFTANTFSLNLSTNGIYNISANITGGTIEPNQMINAENRTTWNITVNEDGYVIFIVNNSNENKTCVVHFFKPVISSRSILFSEVNFSRKVDQSISGLYNFAKYLRDHNFSVFASEMVLNVSNFDAVCISNPLQNISSYQISNLHSSTKLLVFGESYSTFLCEDNIAEEFLLYGFKPRWNPLNELLMNYGINITHYLICDNNTNENSDPIYPLIKGIIPELYFPAYQSSVIDISSNLTIFAQGSPFSWGENISNLGFAGAISFNDQDLNTTPLILYNSSIMAIGDSDVITNERGNAFLFPFLECWLKTGKPYVNFTLNPSKRSISIDGTSKIKINSGIMYDSNEEELNDGILITISTDLGKIVSHDEDPLTPGVQVSIKNKILTFRIQTEKVQGIANISAYNLSLAVIGQVQIKFQYYPIPEFITIFVKNQIDLEKTNDFNFILIISIISIGAVSSVLIKERKRIQTKIVSFKENVKQKNVERKKRKKKEKFVRKKLE